MLNREIPFRPRLEGDFRIRFYNAVSRITENTTLADIENIADEEIKWVTSECTFNLDQRKKYRAVWFLFRDLIHASWKALYRDGVLYMNLPILNGNSTHDGSAPEVKQLLRSWMSESRHERLLTFIDFIKHMEARNSAGHDISELIADGPELANRIEQAHAGRISIKQAVQPYLQLVTENERDQFTGLKISEIWRYFRLTWSTPSETTPGRTMQYLIRDAAHPMHAVMGIASLENCAVQITCRDDYIGWNQHAFIENILTLSGDDARLEFQRLLGYIEDGISGIDYSELCTEMTVRNPTDEDIRMLLDFAANAEQQRQDSLRNSSENGYDDDERSELGSISTKTEQALYNRKRAEQLARLLIAKKTLTDIVNDPDYHWHGSSYNTAAIAYWNDADVTIRNSHIVSGEFTLCGMGRGVASGVITLEDSYFESTSSNKDNGSHWAYAMRLFGSKIRIENCEVKGIQGAISIEGCKDAVISSGKYYTVNSEGNKDAYYALYLTNDAVATITGGEFIGGNDWSGLAIEGTSAVVSGDNDTGLPYGSVILKGGKFSGKAYNHETQAIYEPADGYKWQAISKGDLKWEVVSE